MDTITGRNTFFKNKSDAKDMLSSCEKQLALLKTHMNTQDNPEAEELLKTIEIFKEFFKEAADKADF